ncbi:MAG: tetratricopeptide repeat protein [Candidatus Cloacimonadaceae bacterium]|nr:tetratricopeptide repeat protein [Candidatus Cloacimonadaceae bacterium]
MTMKTRQTLKTALIVLLALILLFFAFELLWRRDPIRQSFAELFWQRGNLDLAQRIWQSGIDPHDGDPIPESGMGKTHYRAGDHSEAERYYDQALKEKPDQAGILYDLGNANYRNEKLDDALSHYKSAMLKDPNDQDAKSNYELVLMRQGYKPPKEEQEPEPEQKHEQQEYENILNALDQKESYDRQRERPQDPSGGQRWW